jgi:AbiU2
MNISDPQIVSLRKSVEAAQQEFDKAVTFHETWRPTAYDSDLQQRMGNSYATNTFMIVRQALWRETMLALMRLRDKRQDTVSMERIARTLKRASVVDALAVDRARCLEDREAMRQDLGDRAGEAIVLIEKYLRGGSHHHVLEALQRMRNEWLAHRAWYLHPQQGQPRATKKSNCSILTTQKS